MPLITSNLARAQDSSCTFPAFSKLPSEIRFKIYGFIDDDESPEVEVLVTNSRARPRQIKIRALTPVPKILHISKESRSEGLKVYFKAIRRNDNAPMVYIKGSKSVLLISTPTNDRYGFDADRLEDLYFKIGSTHVQPNDRLHTGFAVVKIDDVKYTVLVLKLKHASKDGAGPEVGCPILNRLNNGPILEPDTVLNSGGDYKLDVSYLFERLVAYNSPQCWRWISN